MSETFLVSPSTAAGFRVGDHRVRPRHAERRDRLPDPHASSPRQHQVHRVVAHGRGHRCDLEAHAELASWTRDMRSTVGRLRGAVSGLHLLAGRRGRELLPSVNDQQQEQPSSHLHRSPGAAKGAERAVEWNPLDAPLPPGTGPLHADVDRSNVRYAPAAT